MKAKENFPSIEQTFMMIKPDGVKRGLIGRAWKKLEDAGLKLVAARMIQATEEQARGNYPGTDEWLIGMGEKTWANYSGDEKRIMDEMGTTDKKEIGQRIYDGLVRYLSSGPVIISVWEGNEAVKIVRKLAGATDPTTADVGTIRGNWGYDTPQLAVKSGRIVFQTLVHISDSKEEAKREITHWFGDKFEDLSDYEKVDYIGMLDLEK
ncbi:nucleoside-diphosphate kinase [Candidatus Dojkabacteria bacterium]|nr:nucleoside-diphosphate kinase [Candidatus Dojkabacteria bacterium]